MDTSTEVARELANISGSVDKFITAQKTRTADLDTRTSHLEANVTELLQKGARRGGGASLSGNRPLLSQVADAVIAGLRESNSHRASVDMSIRAAAVPLTGADLPPTNIGMTSVYSGALGRLITLLPVRPVDSGNSITFTRVGYAAGGNAAAVQTAELAAKAQSTVETTPATLAVQTVAHWVEVSKQVLDDASELRSILDGLLVGGLLDAVDKLIYAALSAVGNHTPFAAVSGETAGDSVARMSAEIAMRGGTNIAIAMAPADFLAMTTKKAAGSGVYLGVPENLASIVSAVAAVPAGKLLGFARPSGAAWAERMGVALISGLKDDQFVRNALTLLSECRGVTLVSNPAHVSFGNLSATTTTTAASATPTPTPTPSVTK